MRLSILALLHLSLAYTVIVPKSESAQGSVYWLLAGDSTTAPGGGWGDAFLSETVTPGSSGHNYGHSGATTKSFRAGGDWARVIDDIGVYKNDYSVYVTIQFGHNDQKNTSGVTLADYKTNLGDFTEEVFAAGGTPILVTPLTRRTFSGGKVIENLANETRATIEVAESRNVKFIDLNHASTTYVNAIGQKAADLYNLSPSDRTHLNVKGGVLFSRIVSDLLVAKYPDEFQAVTKPNVNLTTLIEEGKPY